jgi:DNA polymerase III sliding clamp (beta) subunit (PCNA family)
MKFTAKVATPIKTMYAFVKASGACKKISALNYIGIQANADTQRVTLCASGADRYVSYTTAADVHSTDTLFYKMKELENLIGKSKAEMTFENSIVTQGKKQGEIFLGTDPLNGMGLPPLDHVETWDNVKTKELCRTVRAVGYAISDNEAKPALTGIRFDGSVTAIDGHRLATVLTSFKPSMHFTAPGKALKAALNVIESAGGEKVQIGCDASYLHIRSSVRDQDGNFVSELVISMRRLVDTYPNWRQLIPNHFACTVEVDRLNWVDGILDLSPYSGDNPTIFSIHNRESYLTAKGKPISGVQVQSILSGTWLKAGAIAFEGRYMMEALQACADETIKLHLNTDKSPLVVRSSETETHLIMPVQIRDIEDHLGYIRQFKIFFKPV